MLVWSAFVDFFATAIAFAIKHLFLYCLRNSTQNKQKKKNTQDYGKKKRKKKQDPWVGAIKRCTCKVCIAGRCNKRTHTKKKKEYSTL